MLGAFVGSAPRFYACSGAVTSDFLTTSHSTEPPQLTRDGVDGTADLLTMTIGGNDAGFSSVLKACISQKLKADAFNALIGPVARWLGLGHDPSCAHSDSFVSSVNSQIDNVFLPVKTTYKSVLSTVDPVNTSVIAADYPKLFPPSHDAQNCLSLSTILTNDDMDFMNTAGDRLDGVLQQAAGEAGVNFVDVRGTFAGHEICGDQGSYLNGISLASGNGGSCTWSCSGTASSRGSRSSARSTRTRRGTLTATRLRSPRSSTPRWTGHAPASPRTRCRCPIRRRRPRPDVGVADLTAPPVTPAAADCGDTYQAGQQVDVSGDGFVPGGAVQLVVTSPGLGSSGELQVGTTTADASGHIAAVVRIPLAATGFTQPGASAGTAFVDAIGDGSAAAHQDDVAMIGLAPHTSSCGAVEQLPFNGFTPPVANPPKVNSVNSGRAVPVKFSVPGSNGTLGDVLADGYPQSAAVSCAGPGAPTSGDPTVSVGGGSQETGDQYNYVWKTDRNWHGCRTLIVKLVDGTYHRAVFDFGK